MRIRPCSSKRIRSNAYQPNESERIGAMSQLRIAVHPVTPDRWPDLARLFEARGGPHFCWCTPYRFHGSHRMSKEAKRSAMTRLVEGETPVGVLAYVEEEPVGWCSVAPRETYQKLDRSRTMPRVTHEPTWRVLCFFVRRDLRRRGVAAALLRGAIGYARERGAVVIEGYPFDTAGISSVHRGPSTLFRGAGFRQEGKRWLLNLAWIGR